MIRCHYERKQAQWLKRTAEHTIWRRAYALQWIQRGKYKKGRTVRRKQQVATIKIDDDGKQIDCDLRGGLHGLAKWMHTRGEDNINVLIEWNRAWNNDIYIVLNNMHKHFLSKFPLTNQRKSSKTHTLKTLHNGHCILHCIAFFTMPPQSLHNAFFHCIAKICPM